MFCELKRKEMFPKGELKHKEMFSKGVLKRKEMFYNVLLPSVTRFGGRPQQRLSQSAPGSAYLARRWFTSVQGKSIVILTYCLCWCAFLFNNATRYYY